MSNKKDLEYLQNQLGVRDSMILNRLIDNHLEKIDRLNNIINELEKWLEEEYKRNRRKTTNFLFSNIEACVLSNTIDKLKKLKEGNNND